MTLYSYAEREDTFIQSFGNAGDAAEVLPYLATALIRAQATIVGKSTADHIGRTIVAKLGWKEEEAKWEHILTEEVSQVFSEWAAGEDLHLLQAYAFFGIDYTGEGGRPIVDIAADRAVNLKRAEEIQGVMPILALWDDLKEKAQPYEQFFDRMIAAARSRIALDTGARVPVEGLAALAGISDSRMRSIAKKSDDAILPVGDDKAVPHDRAKAWLEDQKDFLPSIMSDVEQSEDSEIVDPIFVPVSADGSRFDTTLRHNAVYQIGPKGSEITVDDYKAALAELARMPVACWRRPSEGSGRRGIVRAIHWERVSGADPLYSDTEDNG